MPLSEYLVGTAATKWLVRYFQLVDVNAATCNTACYLLGTQSRAPCATHNLMNYIVKDYTDFAPSLGGSRCGKRGSYQSSITTVEGLAIRTTTPFFENICDYYLYGSPIPNRRRRGAAQLRAQRISSHHQSFVESPCIFHVVVPQVVHSTSGLRLTPQQIAGCIASDGIQIKSLNVKTQLFCGRGPEKVESGGLQ